MKPKVSVIVPVYNVQDYLAECLNSIINQTYQDLEIICIEDCSTDSSRELLCDLVKKDSRIQCVFNEKNMGLSACRNIGIERASGKYILFVDSDDFIEADCVEQTTNCAEETGADMVSFNYKQVTEKGEKTERHFSCIHARNGKDFFCETVNDESFYVAVWTYLYNLQFLKQTGISFKPGMLHEDNLFSFQIVLKANRIERIDRTLYHYRRIEQSITGRSDNYLDRIKSMCVVVDYVQKTICNTKDQGLLNSMERFLRRQIFKTRMYYQKLDIVPDGLVRATNECSRVLPAIQGSLYNGYFPQKLSQGELDTIRNSNTVIIYGAGTVANGMAQLLNERGIRDYEMVVTEGDNHHSISDFIPVKEECVVIIASAKYFNEMAETVEKLGFPHVIYPKY